MKPRATRPFAVCLIWASLSSGVCVAAEESYELAFSTYFGGGTWEHARDICTDHDGNIYVVGGTSSRDFPTTPGAYDRTFHAGGKQIGDAGLCDGFVEVTVIGAVENPGVYDLPRGQSSLLAVWAALAGRPVRLHIAIKDADLFALRFHPGDA